MKDIEKIFTDASNNVAMSIHIGQSIPSYVEDSLYSGFNYIQVENDSIRITVMGENTEPEIPIAHWEKLPSGPGRLAARRLVESGLVPFAGKKADGTYCLRARRPARAIKTQINSTDPIKKDPVNSWLRDNAETIAPVLASLIPKKNRPAAIEYLSGANTALKQFNEEKNMMPGLYRLKVKNYSCTAELRKDGSVRVFKGQFFSKQYSKNCWAKIRNERRTLINNGSIKLGKRIGYFTCNTEFTNLTNAACVILGRNVEPTIWKALSRSNALDARLALPN